MQTKIAKTLNRLNSESLARVVALVKHGCYVVKEDGYLMAAAMLADGGIDEFEGQINWLEVSEPEEGFIEAMKAELAQQY